ncbi:MAG: nitroreductase family protein [Victivallaceae bacterium]
MELQTALRNRRTIRRFQVLPVAGRDLDAMLEAAQASSSGGNTQPLRYVVVTTPAKVEAVFNQCRFGALVQPRRSPQWGIDAPAVFIAVTVEKPEPTPVDYAVCGGAIMAMQFAAFGLGLGCCWIGAFDRSQVREILSLGANEEVMFLVAVGHPAEKPVLEWVDAESDIKYYLDGEDTLHVPKRRPQAVSRHL